MTRGDRLGLAALTAAAAGISALLGRGDWIFGWGVAVDALLSLWLAALALIDARRMILPEILTIPLALAGFALAAWVSPDQLTGHFIGFALGWGLMAAVAAAFRSWRGRDGLGGGDAMLLGAAGAWLGPLALPSLLFLAALAALGWAVLRRVRLLPFGPFLAAAFWAIWVAGAWLPWL